MRIAHRIRKLADLKDTPAYPFIKRRVLVKFSARPFVGSQNTYRQTQLASNQTKGFRKVGIVANHHPSVIPAHVRIMKKMARDVDIRAFFFSANYRFKPERIGVRHWELNSVLYELAENDFQTWDCSKCPEVYLLTRWNVRVAGASTDMRRKVLYLPNIMPREQIPAEGRKVQPLVWSTLHDPIVEIKPVNINIRGHKSRSRGLTPASRPAPEGAGGITRLLSYAMTERLSSGFRGSVEDHDPALLST